MLFFHNFSLFLEALSGSLSSHGPGPAQALLSYPLFQLGCDCLFLTSLPSALGYLSCLSLYLQQLRCVWQY